MIAPYDEAAESRKALDALSEMDRATDARERWELAQGDELDRTQHGVVQGDPRAVPLLVALQEPVRRARAAREGGAA